MVGPRRQLVCPGLSMDSALHMQQEGLDHQAKVKTDRGVVRDAEEVEGAAAQPHSHSIMEWQSAREEGLRGV